MPVFENPEQYETWLREELPRIAERMKTNPSEQVSLEEMRTMVQQWKLEDQAGAVLKQSA